MSPSADVQYRIGLILVISLGSALLLLQLLHMLRADAGFWPLLYGILLPMAFAIGLLSCGIWLALSDVDGSNVFRITLWCVLGSVALTIGAVQLILYQQADGVQMSNSAFVIAGQASLGGVVGFIVGIYSVRQETVRSHAERLSDHLTVLNRVLRHDIRNEATVIQGRAELLTTDTERNRHPEMIQKHAENLVDLSEQAQLVDRLIRQGEPDRVIIDIRSVIEAHLEQLCPTVEIETSLEAATQVHAHPLIESALGNVLDNAVEHNDADAPRIRVDTGMIQQGRTQYVEIRIADNGPGIPDEQVAVLERGYETQLEHTEGLGLWLVHWIVSESDGMIGFDENSPRGSVVRICLKRAQ